MVAIKDVDRKNAEELRILLAELTGFWHMPGDQGPLCLALARHREQAERRILENLQFANADAGAAIAPAAKARRTPSLQMEALPG